MGFHNPYHFIPVEPARAEDKIAFDAPELTHDRYLPERFSGRVICRLITETPTFVGARRTREADAQHPAEVEHYKLDGRPAIPVTTLRGMLSSLVEAATNSALRILEDETYSFRLRTDESVSAIGMIVEQQGKLFLRPLTLPTLERTNDDRGGRKIKVPDNYRPLYLQHSCPPLRAYFDDESHAGVSHTGVTYHSKFQTYTNENRKFYYLKLLDCAWERNQQGQVLAQDNLLKNRAAYIGREKQNEDDMPLSQQEYDNLIPDEQRHYTRGILRIMSTDGRDLPDNRRSEVFIPYPTDAVTWKTFAIQDEAIARFKALADGRIAREHQGIEDANKLLPYNPVNTPRNLAGGDARRFRLKTGDLVFFRPSVDGTTIEEISLSAIWRGRVEDTVTKKGHTTRAFFGKVDKDLLPFNDERTCVTVAESMFGFVNESRRTDGDDGNGKMRAFAGRVLPSAARLYGVRDANNPAAWAGGSREQSLEDAQLPATTLKILSSPKPPSPAMYFKGRDGNGTYIAKSGLNAEDHRAQGRKFYLHHQEGAGDTWTTRSTEHLKQKVCIAPVKSGAVFYFHIDFENLSAKELGALLYALRPTKEFRHKVGMGKPLGLGTVRIDPVALLGINRRERYTAQGLFAPRYSHAWVASDVNEYGWIMHNQNGVSDELPEQYANEIASQSNPFAPFSPPALYTDFRNQMRPQIRHALEIVGDPAKLQARVCTPLSEQQMNNGNDEEETFKWFVNNDDEERRNNQRGTRKKISPRRQWLKPLSDPANAERIEPLEANTIIEVPD